MCFAILLAGLGRKRRYSIRKIAEKPARTWLEVSGPREAGDRVRWLMS